MISYPTKLEQMMASRRLNGAYFELLMDKSSGNFFYEAYRPKNQPMILYSLVDGSPLAALTLRLQDVPGNEGRALITRRPSKGDVKCDFQGLVDRDDQEFELVITNLGHEGMINFNIMRSGDAVGEVNPGGVNEINELRAGESYAVKCDQCNGNRSLILSTLKKKEDGSAVTVREDEKEAFEKDEKPKGTYFHLSVVPQSDCANLVKKFENTQWSCVDVFYRQLPASMAPRIPPPMAWAGYRGIGRGFIPESAAIGYSGNQSYIGGAYYGRTNLEGAPPREEEDCDDEEMGFGLFDDLQPQSRAFSARLEPQSESLAPASASGLISKGGDFSLASGVISKGVPESASTAVRQMEAFGSDRGPGQQMILDSQAANVRGGRRIEVYSAQTGIEYAYEKMSTPCVIGLSVAPGLRFAPEPTKEELVAMVTELIDYHIRTENSQLVELLRQTFVEENCIICLDEAPNVVFYQCGHQCMHQDCLEGMRDRRCPLCRCYIVADIPVTV